MLVSKWLSKATIDLTQAGIGTARLDALVLLEDVTGRGRAWLLANPEHGLSADQVQRLTKLLNERADHTPLAYVRGTTEFYGRNFVITPAVLVPRPESETMIDLFKTIASGAEFQGKSLKIADVGSGSGALGITAKLESPRPDNTSVDLLEIDHAALKIAQTNVEKHTTSISVIQSDLLEDSSKDYDILLCNLPYVPDDHTINPAAEQEPRLAIFGGPDGLDVYRRLFGQVRRLPNKPLYILSEALPPQHAALTGIAAKAGYESPASDDFIQVFRLK